MTYVMIFLLLFTGALWAETLAPVEMGHGNANKIHAELQKLQSFIYKLFGRNALDDDHHVPVTPPVLLEKLEDLKKQMRDLVGQMENVERSNAQLKEQLTGDVQKTMQVFQTLEQRVQRLEHYRSTAEEKAFDDRIQNMTEDELYAIAERMKKENQPQLAERALKLYIERYPTTPRLQDAHRHLMDITYAQERYTEAALFGAQTYKINPHHPEIPEVLLKMAHALKKLGKKVEARTTLDKLKSDYPNLPSDMNLRLAQALHDLETEGKVVPDASPSSPPPSLASTTDTSPLPPLD